MSLKSICVVASCAAALALTGCTTRYRTAPVEQYVMPDSPVAVSNAQIDKEPRVLFSDGITTYMTDYRGWAEIVRVKVAGAVAQLPVKSPGSKSLRVSINQIDCGGHYVADCAVSIMIETGTGHREVINSGRFNGYPMDSALDKALGDVAGKVLMNSEILDYLVQG
nr:hypothetical protein [Pseudomonas sp. s4]